MKTREKYLRLVVGP